MMLRHSRISSAENFRPGSKVGSLLQQVQKNVLEALTLEANWLGVVDRDAWTDEQIAEKRRNLANLLVLPRFCIESYLIVPEELWLGFQPKHQQAINGGIQAFIQAVHDVLPQWRNHAALWNVIHPLWERLRAAGFNTAFHDLNTAQNDAEVEQCLRQWSQHLDPDVLLAQIQTQKLTSPHAPQRRN